MTFWTSLAIGTPFIPTGPQLAPFVAELCLIGGIVATLLAPLFLKRTNVASGVIALATMIISLVALFCTGGEPFGLSLRGMLLSDPMAVFWKVLLLVFVAGVVLMWFSTTRSTMHEGDGPEFFTLLLVATLGMMLMVSTSNLLMLVIAVETASLSSYVLAGFRKTQRLGAEAALKYVLFGAATSGIMIYGLSLLYGMYGTLQLAGDGGIAEQIAHHGGPTPLLTLIMACIIAGLGFKISAVPLHFWCPDVFEGASTEVSAFLSVASKGAALILLMRICMLLAEAMGYVGGPSYLTVLSAILGTLGAITATVGNTAAFSQTNVKRLLAWSSIAHAGYMLCGLSLLVSFRADVVQNGVNVAVQALLIYLAVYVFMNLGAFLVAGVVERETGTADLYSFAGLGRRSPWLAAFMAVFLFSLVGLPPFAGFVAKLNLLWRLVDNGGWWWFLVGVIGVNTVFSLYYYARILRAMYLETSEQPRLSLNPIGSLLAAACALILVVLFLGFSPFDRAAGAASRMVGGPQGCVPSAVAAHQ